MHCCFYSYSEGSVHGDDTLKLLLRYLHYNTETATCFDSQGAIIVE